MANYTPVAFDATKSEQYAKSQIGEPVWEPKTLLMRCLASSLTCFPGEYEGQPMFTSADLVDKNTGTSKPIGFLLPQSMDVVTEDFVKKDGTIIQKVAFGPQATADFWLEIHECVAKRTNEYVTIGEIKAKIVVLP